MSAVLQPGWTPRVALYARYSSDQQRSASIDDQFRTVGAVSTQKDGASLKRMQMRR